MSRFRKLPALLIIAVIFCAIIPQPSRANDTSLYPTGYVPSDIDRSLIDQELPILRKSGQDYPASLNDDPIPAYYDLREHGRFPGLRNQNPYGVCWAFSALGSLESSYLTQYPSEDIDLSEMHLAYFVYGDPRPGKSFPMTDKSSSILHQGGNEYEAVAFLSRMGTVSESILPYSNPNPDRFPEDYKPAGIRLKAAYYLPLATRSPEITKRIVMETGAVNISYINDYSAYHKSASGKTAFFSTDNSGGGHAVIIIGWDDDFPREYFNESDDLRPENNGAWLVRNSWGAEGDNGCFWMSYEQPLTGTAVFIPEKSAKSLKHYGYDDLGRRGSTSYEWCANVFKSEGNEDLKYIGFQTIRNNQSHDIYVYDLGTESPDSPVNGTLIASLENVYTPYTGYNTVEISGHVEKGHYFSVVLKGDGWMATGGVSGNTGVSYGSSDGAEWASMNSNPCIKAFTIPDPYNNPELKLIEITPQNFPDAIFFEYLRDYDLDDNGYFSAHEISIIKSIKLPKSGLHTLKGVEFLTNLISLDVSGNHLTALDLDANTSLAYLSCTSQDTSGLTLTHSGGKYSVNLKGYISGDISRVIPESVKASSGDTDYDSSSGVAEFDALASSVSYSYDTGFNGQSMNVTAYVRWEDDSLVNIDAINFPDDNFRAFIRKNYDKDNDGWLSEAERNKVSRISVTGARVESVKGIEFFPALTELYVSQHKLTALDVSKNTALSILDCSSNKITVLDLSNNTALTQLLCRNNGMSSLDLTNNTALQEINCTNNQLEVLDVSNQKDLTSLKCSNNQLAALDVIKNTALKVLYCYGNRISALDVSACTDLQDIACEENCLTELNLADNTKLGGIYSRRTDGSILAYAEYDSQKSSGLNVNYSGGKYTVSLKDYVSDITRIRASSVRDTAGTPCTYDSTSGIATFDSRPSGLFYEYDTGYTKVEDEQEGYRYMDVTLTRGVEIIASGLPAAELGVSYSAQVASSGASSVTFSIVSGDFPDGLSMDMAGKISGTPTKTGVYTFTVEASSAGKTDTLTLTLKVFMRPVIVTESLPEGFAGTAYSYPVVVTGWPAPTLTASGLPEGLDIDKEGTISGIPKKAKTYTVTLSAMSEAGSADKVIKLKINGKKNLSITPKSLSLATWGKKYSRSLKLSGLKNAQWQISGNLPDGLTLDTAKATISGIPKQAGIFSFTVTAGNGAITVTKNYALTVKGIKPKLTGSMKPGKVGEFCCSTLQAAGTTPISWSIIGLPSGMSYDVNNDGTQCVISGIPSEGCKKISVSLKNSGGYFNKSISLKVAYVKPKILTKAIGPCTVDVPYTVKLDASGSPVIKWSWNTKKPPEGWTLTEDGTISGTPSKKGKISLKVKAANNGGKATASYTLEVLSNNDEQTYSYFDASPVSETGYAYFTAAMLPAVSVDEEGLYEFTVSISDDVPDGELVLTGADEAFFLDGDGEITTGIPESRIVTVDVWLEPGKVYEPVIMVKVLR